MAFKLNDRVKESSATTGTGTFTLGGAVSGFETFAAGIGGNNTTYYCIFETGTNNFEVGFGTLNAGASTLARTYIISSSNSDAAVNFAGATEVFCTVPGAKIGLPFPEENASSSAPKTITVKVASKSGNHPYQGVGSGNAYYLNGLEAPALRLTGVDSSASAYAQYYRFDQSDSSNSGHPLRFYLDSAKSVEYTTGVTNTGSSPAPGSSGAYTQIAVDENTPNILYYQCSSHGYMGNHVVNVSNTVNINNVTGQIIPGKFGGTDFSNGILIGHATTGTLSTANNNIGVGASALDAITSGDNNIAVGIFAGSDLTTSSNNVFLGGDAGRFVSTSGGQNMYIGSTSGYYNQTGTDNVGLGANSLLGASGNSNSFNVAIGTDSVKSVTTGGRNIGIGHQAGDNITSGSGNVIIGAGVDADSATGSRQLKIAGYDGSTTTTWISGDNSGNVTVTGTVTANGETLSAGVSAGFAVAMAIAL